MSEIEYYDLYHLELWCGAGSDSSVKRAVRLLIADWRKRGERIAELEQEVADWYNRGVKEGHGY